MLAPFGRRSIAMILSILPGLRVMDFFDTEAVADLFKDGLLVDVGCAAVVRCLFDNGFEDFALLIKSPSVAAAKRCHHLKPRTGASPWGRSPSGNL